MRNTKMNFNRKLISVIGPKKRSKIKKEASVHECPICGNNDLEKLIKLRRSFYECSICKTLFDTDLNDTNMKTKDDKNE